MAANAESKGQSDDPISLFIDEQRYHGKSERTLNAYNRVLRNFEAYALYNDTGSKDFEQLDRRDCMRWVHSQRGDLAESTIASYASYVNRFFRYMVEIGEFQSNPMQLVMEQMPESIDQDPVRRDISIEQMRIFLDTIDHPLTKVIVLTFLKTGIRVGELCNLDLRDLALETPLLNQIKPRPVVEAHGPALFVDSDIDRGDRINGEERISSNKRQRATIIPLDQELQAAISEWLAIRPDSYSDANPLFVDTGSSWGQRIDPEGVRYRVRRIAESYGWHTNGGDASNNVTPHYFRHFFTTHMRDRIGDRGVVKYLRGDVADDIIDTYTHNWGDRVRRRYERHIYQLL